MIQLTRHSLACFLFGLAAGALGAGAAAYGVALSDENARNSDLTKNSVMAVVSRDGSPGQINMKFQDGSEYQYLPAEMVAPRSCQAMCERDCVKAGKRR